MTYNPKINEIIAQVAEVAGYLWDRGWAERNGGNISYNLTEYADETLQRLPGIGEPKKLPMSMPHLGGHLFLVTGTGKRMRYVHSNPMENASIIRVAQDGKSYQIVAEKEIIPTSELPSHLLIHDYIAAACRNEHAVIHTHPTELVAMTHNPSFLQKDAMGTLLWSMIPETRAFCPKGLGIVPYCVPGSTELAQRTVDELRYYDVVMWEKHGAVAIGSDAIEAFDQIDTFSKSAKIYLAGCSMGFRPQGMSCEQMDELKNIFGL